MVCASLIVTNESGYARRNAANPDRSRSNPSRRHCQRKIGLPLMGMAASRNGMSNARIFRYFKTSPEIIRLAVMMYVRYPLSLRNVEDLLHERGIDITHETVRFWWNRFGTIFAAEIRRSRVQAMRHFQHRRWHLDEVFVKINGVKHYLWRAVDHEGEVLESFVTKRRDRKAALKFLRKSLRRHLRVETIVTDRLASYGAALKAMGAIDKREVGRLAEQPGGEFAPAIPTTETGDAPLPADAKSAEIRRVAWLDPQPFQPGPDLHQPSEFQGTTHRRSRRVASNLRGLINARVGRFLRLFWFV